MEPNGNIIIVDITWELARRMPEDQDNVFSARGYVAVFGEDAPAPVFGIEGALQRAAESVAENLPAGAQIAITSMVDRYNANRRERYRVEYDAEHAHEVEHFRWVFGPLNLVRSDRMDFLTSELEHILVGLGFAIVTPNLDETHVAERRYWGLESDASVAARIGRFAGATVVIIVGEDGTGNLRRLRLRAVDTATMQVIGTASETER